MTVAPSCRIAAVVSAELKSIAKPETSELVAEINDVHKLLSQHGRVMLNASCRSQGKGSVITCLVLRKECGLEDEMEMFYVVSFQLKLKVQGYVQVHSGCHSQRFDISDRVEDPSQEFQFRNFNIAVGSDVGTSIASTDIARIVVRVTPLATQGYSQADTVTVRQTESPASIPSLSKNLGAAFESSRFTDVEVIASDGETFKAHRQILAMRSPVFEASLFGGGALMQEAQTGQIKVSAPGTAVKQMLCCIYTDELQHVENKDDVEMLFVLGHAYQVPRLLHLAETQLLTTLSVSNVATRLQLSQRYDVPDLRQACAAIVKNNITAVMATEGWKCIAQDPAVMKLLLSATDQAIDSSAGREKRRRLR